jgi:hypothetical protein
MRVYERKVMDERSYTVRRELAGSECDEGRSAARVSHLLWSDSSWCPLPLQGPRLSRPTSLTTPVQTVSYTLAVHGLMSNHTGTRASNPPTPKRSGKMHQGESLNHLLNFHLPPRQAQPVPRRSRKYGTQHGVWNKERECLYHPFRACPGLNRARVRQCPVPFRHEPDGRLHSALRGSRHVGGARLWIHCRP